MKLHLKNRKLKPIKKRALKKIYKQQREHDLKIWDFLEVKND